MKIKITRAELVGQGACQKGLSWYDSHAPLGVWEADWTVGLQAALLRERAEFVAWAAHKGLLPLLPMQGANLREGDLGCANLRGANLRGADLSGANLREANLKGANLTGANLTGANLRCAYLTGADLSGADLIGADLSGADLTGADLGRADLTGADLSGANLTGANLKGANLKGAMRYPSDRPIPGVLVREGVLVAE